MNSEQVLSISHLRKQYGKGMLAVDDISLTLNKGEIFGLLGPNGSGKTTTILMLLGLLEPTSGSVDILGFDPLRTPLEVKRRVGYLSDTVGFYDTMTAYENLDYTARFLGLSAKERRERILGALQRMRLENRKNDKVHTFSHGMKQRLGLAEVLVKNCEIAILDEPTQGLDPESVAEFLSLITSLRDTEHMTILLSSHQLEEVQSVCDRVGLFYRGKLLKNGTVAELSEQQFGGRQIIELRVDSEKNLAETFAGISEVTKVLPAGRQTWNLECMEDVRPAVANAVFKEGIGLISIEMQMHSLYDIYKASFKEVADETA
ncbi:ABC-type multidrug transport system, ATPase component [Sphaerochaeta pleomorpha str. Grapes]|uniref:ABC-type multidrug transport system, ATPase component n=1 Tax=Sphaerochaeta pleomorpha (strain ATCC BAA-1885 / DSM 22778 / Grapes) TaxID=158190 RepID=G8QTB3_SPHPG|nr:ABC transporter ATP-binding protein [Sphaerochaeta pleomorpha]AEV29080.1 ABC-type multidrug transport system, ATPase component [Sphaerochaeta pleomorpha str. Grapes]